MKFAPLFIGFFLISIQVSAQDSQLKAGKEIYTSMCVNCHMETGEGVAGVFPPLAQSDFLLNNKRESIYAVKYGMEGEVEVNGETYNNYMSNLGLSDEEVMHVMNYVLNAWGNQGGEVSLEEVIAIKKNK